MRPWQLQLSALACHVLLCDSAAVVRREVDLLKGMSVFTSGADAEAWRTWWHRSRTVASHAAPDGLPWATGARPSWLKGSDGLVVDARRSGVAESAGGMLLVMVVNQDSYNEWEKEGGKRPKWLRSILAANRAHVRRYNHAMVIRWQPTGEQLTEWQIKRCEPEKKTRDECRKSNERENINWEKHLMLLDYLESPQNFTHVLMLDADAVFVRPGLDTMRRMAEELERSGKELFVADEDWLRHGAGRINGGVLLARNGDFTRSLFRDLWQCHREYTLKSPRTLSDGEIGCGGNEMAALNEWYGRYGISSKIQVASGRRWNRGGEVLYRKSENDADELMNARGAADDSLELLHFMGSAKSGAADTICLEKYGNAAGLACESWEC